MYTYLYRYVYIYIYCYITYMLHCMYGVPHFESFMYDSPCTISQYVYIYIIYPKTRDSYDMTSSIYSTITIFRGLYIYIYIFTYAHIVLHIFIHWIHRRTLPGCQSASNNAPLARLYQSKGRPMEAPTQLNSPHPHVSGHGSLKNCHYPLVMSK